MSCYYTNNNNYYLVQSHEYNGFEKYRNDLIVEKPYPPSDLRIVIKRAPTMAPPKSKVEEIQEALKLPWLPFDMSQPNNGESVKNLVRDIYVSCKLIPTFEDFVKERSSELENIMKRRPTVVPKIKIQVESDSPSVCSNLSDSGPESSLTKCDTHPENPNVIVIKRKKLIVRTVKRILNNDRRSFKLLNVSMKKTYRRTKVKNCVVSLVRLPDDQYHKMINQTQVESHVPETTNSLVPVQNEEIDTSTAIDTPEQSNIVTSETSEISQTEKSVQELVIEKTIDTPRDNESTNATKVNIIKMTDERLTIPKQTDITNNLDKTNDPKQLVNIVKTTEPKALIISQEVELTKKPIQEKPSSYNDAEEIEMKPSLSEVNIINNSISKNVDISVKTMPISVAACSTNDVEIKPSLSEINVNNSSSKSVDISVRTIPTVEPCATNDVEIKSSLSEINIIKSPFKNIDISVKTVPKDVQPCPANNSGVKTSLSEVSIIKSPSKNVDITLKTISKDVTSNEISLTKSPRPNMSFPSLSGIDISIKPVVSPRPLLPEIDLRKKSEILDSINAKTVVKEINIKKSPDSRLPEINIVKSDVSKPVDSLNISISKEVHIARNPTDGPKTLHEVDIRKKVEPTASITRVSKEVNIERKSGDPVTKSKTESSTKSDNSSDSETKKQNSCVKSLVDTEAITYVPKQIKIERKSVDSLINSDDHSSDSVDGLTTQQGVDVQKKEESKASITRISKEVNIERKSTDSHKSTNEKLKRQKSTESENSSEVKSITCKRSSAEETSKILHEVDMWKKLEPTTRIFKEVNEKKSDSPKSINEKAERLKSTKPDNSEATKNSSSCGRSDIDGSKKLQEVDMWKSIEHSVPKKVKRSKSTKSEDNTSNQEETNKSNSCERSSPDLSKSRIKSILKSSTYERKSTSSERSLPDLVNSRVKHVSKSSSEDRKSTSSERSLPDLAKTRVKQISKSSSEERKSTSSERSSPDLSKTRVKQISKSSSEERKSTSSERSSPDLSKTRVKQISKSSSEERKSTGSERSSPDLSKLDGTSKTSITRKSDDDGSSNVNKDSRKHSKLKRKRSQDTTNSKHRKSSLIECPSSKETEKTRTSQERDSSIKSETDNQKISKHRRHSTHSSRNESSKEHRKSSDERGKHRNSKDKEMEPENKKPRSKSPENVLDNKPEDNSREIRFVSPPKNKTMDDHPAVQEALQDNKGNKERHCESNSQILNDPGSLKLLKFTTYSCIKCDAEFSSHAEWANHTDCKSIQETIIKVEKFD